MQAFDELGGQGAADADPLGIIRSCSSWVAAANRAYLRDRGRKRDPLYGFLNQVYRRKLSRRHGTALAVVEMRAAV